MHLQHWKEIYFSRVSESDKFVAKNLQIRQKSCSVAVIRKAAFSKQRPYEVH